MHPQTSCKRVPWSGSNCGQTHCRERLNLVGEWADSLRCQLVGFVLCHVVGCTVKRYCWGRGAETSGGKKSLTWGWCLQCSLQQQRSPSTGATKVSSRLTFHFQLCLLSLNPLTLRERGGGGRNGELPSTAEWKP